MGCTSPSVYSPQELSRLNSEQLRELQQAIEQEASEEVRKSLGVKKLPVFLQACEEIRKSLRQRTDPIYRRLTGQ
jgi:hypothetical protein